MLDLSRLTRDTIAAALSGPAETRAAFLRDAAEAGHAEAQAVFGQMLLDGTGVAADPRAALGWFKRAAAQHHPMAINMVGRCYDLGWGTPVDKARAATCFRIAADMGLAWAMYNYATALALGAGVAQDKAAALAWLERAVESGTGLVRAKALNFIGSFAEDGWAGPVDMAKAAACYREAAEGGDFRGCFNHARLRAAAGDLDAAARWLRQAAALGHDRFRAQMRDWLARAPEPLRSLGVDPC